MNAADIQLTGEILTAPAKGKSPKGKTCLFVQMRTEKKDLVTLAAFSREAQFHLARLCVGETVSIAGKLSKLSIERI